MKLSHEMKLMIAKSGTKNKWLPLWMHAMDTANVMRELIHLQYSTLSELCGMSIGEFEKIAILLAYIHDIGKITPLFQFKILKALPERRSLFENCGIRNISDRFKNKNKSHHTKCGEAILLYLRFPREFSSIVGAHHGMPSNNVRHHIKDYPFHFWGIPSECNFWVGLYQEWADFSLEQAGFCDISEIPVLSIRAQVLLSALLIMADWLASNQTNFALLDEDVILSEDEYPKNRCYNAFEKLKLPKLKKLCQVQISDDEFEKRFSFPMKKMQKEIIAAVENCTKPGLFILEAPMGTGKTEAALAAAEILFAKCSKTGLYFGLPTQATANGIFERVVQWARIQSYDAVHSINLAHGNAEFQPVFAELKNDSEVQTDFDGESGLVVNSFFSGNKTSLLSDFVVATVDKLLMSALKKKHVMLLHLGLSQKVVIVDECHAYDAYMNQYLDTVLAWMHEYHVPVILLSATLPPGRREKLIEAYFNDKDKHKTFEIPEVTYPRLTFTDGCEIVAKALPKEGKDKKVTIIRGNDGMVVEKITEAVHAGACVGIICNTVLRAQYFAEIARKVTGANVILYHAQYILPDRMEREERLKKVIGKKSDANIRKGVVVVGTQVLEQSLDIDFDLLITDLCPMDLLIQRIGRLWRHLRAERPCMWKNAECIVLGIEEIEEASKHIYAEWLLLRTKKLLPAYITIPNDIDFLVNETYREAEPESEEEKAALKGYKNRQAGQENSADNFKMLPPQEDEEDNDFHGWISNPVGDDENNALAAVRDSTPLIEVLVLVQNRDGMLEMLPWQTDGKKYSPRSCPADDECRRIAQQKLRLPVRFCYNINGTISELKKMDKYLAGFLKSRWLEGQHVLLLDENLSAELCGFKVTYLQDSGFTYVKAE